jgi:hypothetical protein
LSKHSVIDTSVNRACASIFVVHPSSVDVSSVSVLYSNRMVLKIGFTRYPPLRTTSPGRHVAVELAVKKTVKGSKTLVTFGPIIL